MESIKKNLMHKSISMLLAAIMFMSLCCMCPLYSSAASNVEITYDGQVVDTFNGISARYIKGLYNSNTGSYCCADYVKRYYSQVFGVGVYNLLTSQTPKSSTSGKSFTSTNSPKSGDIAYMTNSSGSGHWAVIKSVSGSNVTIIEQNWKWGSNGKTYASVNRVVNKSYTKGLKFYTLSGGSSNTNSSTISTAHVYYSGHSQNIGNLATVSDGATLGTTGQGLRLEYLKATVGGMSGSINYKVHCQNYGWMGEQSNGGIAGTSGQSLRMEAVQIRLTGTIANYYNVQYRTHVENIGWTGWVSNGQTSGTTGQSLRIEAIEIRLVRK